MGGISCAGSQPLGIWQHSGHTHLEASVSWRWGSAALRPGLCFLVGHTPGTPDPCHSPIALLTCELSASEEHDLLSFSRSVVFDSLWLHGLQHARLPVLHYLLEFAQTHVHWEDNAIQPSHPLSPRFSSCPQSLPASGSFPMSPLLSAGGQSIGAAVLAPVLPMTIQDWFPLGLTCLISLHSKGLSRVFSNTTVQKHQFFGTQSSL